MKNLLIALALAAAPLAGQAADQLSYTWVEGDWVHHDRGVDGPALRGSANLGKSGFYATGSFAHLDGDDSLADSGKVNASELGLGYHHAVAAKTDLIGEVAYRNARAHGADIDGARASVGVRSALGERVEGYVKGNYYDASDYHGDVTGSVGGQFKLNKTWGATAEAELGNGDHAYLLGVRASF